MASGEDKGGRDDENPFSFKKFVKKSGGTQRNVESGRDGESDEEPDLRDNSEHPKENPEAKVKRPDDNPFSFKRFIQSCDGNQKPKVNYSSPGGLANLDLANGLPDFVQDHYLNDREHLKSRTRIPATEVRLPDFALDSAGAINSVAGHQDDAYDSPGDGGGSGGIGARSKFTPNENLGNRRPLDDREVLELNLRRSVEADEHIPLHATSSGKGTATEATGGLPDFLSDSCLGAFAIPPSSKDIDNVPLEFEDAMYEDEIGRDKSRMVNLLQEENRNLRRQLDESREFARRESARAAELVTEIEILRKHEADETAALENMVQQVEGNLQTTLQRAVKAENAVTKLKQELASLQGYTNSLLAENEMLKTANYNSLREKSVNASHQITAAAKTAEQLLKQLLTGVDSLRTIASVLASTDHVCDLPSDEQTDTNAKS